jgi:hypothetical protein
VTLCSGLLAGITYVAFKGAHEMIQPRHANVRASKAESTDIREVIDRLNHMQQSGVIKQYAIGGAVGASFYMEPIETEDVDVFMPFPGAFLISPQPMMDYFRQHGATLPESSEANAGQVLYHGWLVQFLPPSSRLSEEAIEQAVIFEIDQHLTASVMSLEHLAALALETGRAKDKARLLQFMESGKLDMKRLLSIVSAHGLTSQWTAFKTAFRL